MRTPSVSFALLLSFTAAPLLAQGRGGSPPKSEAAASPADVIAKVDPKEWKTPWPASDRPRDPFADAQGRVWFVGQNGNYVAYLDSKTGQFKQYQIDEGTNPHNLVVHDGMVWFTGNRNNRIVKMDPATGKLTTYMIPDTSVHDPHTMIFDKNGMVWFTAQTAGVVGRFNPKTAEFKLHKFPRGTLPYGIVLDSKGRPYFDEFGVNKIGTFDPATMELKEFTLPDPGARPRRIAITSDDIVWYGDYARGYLGRLDPKTGQVKEFPMPSGSRSNPYGMVMDDRDIVWLAESGVAPNRLVSFDTRRLTWVEQFDIGGPERNTIRHMTFDPTTRQIWFGTDQGFIGRIKVPPKIIHP